MKNKTFTLTASLSLLCGLVSGQNIWTQKNNFLGSGRNQAVAFSIGTKGYIGTGYDGTNSYRDFWEWNSSTNAWTQKADFGGTARHGAVGIASNTKGYIGTGNDGTNRKDFWEYDPIGNAWTQKTDFGGTARWGAIGFSTDTTNCGIIYIGLGNDGIYKNDLWVYDPSTDLWSQKATFPSTGRSGAVAFSIGTKGYVGTGFDGSNYHNDFWEYYASTNNWTQKTNYGGSPIFLSSSFSIGNYGYIGTGSLSGTDFWKYDPSNDSWNQVANFTGTARASAVGFSIGNKGYIGTGYDIPNGYIQDFWEYSPLTAINENYLSYNLSIFPNPLSIQTTLQSDNLLRNATFTVDNCFGQTVKQMHNLSGQTITFNRDNLPSGFYFVRLTQDKQTIATKKLLITD